MPSPYNITNIPAPRVDFIDPRTGLMAREWYRFFFNLFNLTGAGTTDTSLADLQVGPPAVNDLLGELGITYDQAQIAAMMAQYEQATRDIQNQLDTAPAAPQLGTLSTYNEDNVRLIGFDTSPSPAVPNPAPTGTLYWDGNSTLGLQMNQSVLVRIGQAQFVYAKASSAITKGQLCKHTGAIGASGVITAAPTSTNMTDTTQIIGVAAQDIALNDFGFIQVAGDLRGFDTTGSSVGEVWADGDSLYYNPSFVGSFTKNKPSAPNLKTYIGEIINAGSGGSGSINIHLIYGSTLGGSDSNVQFGTLSDKDLIQYDGTAQYWKNVAPSSISIGTATNLSGGAAGSVPYQTGANTTTFLPIGTASQVLKVNAGATAPEWVSGAALSKVDDTNVTLTLGGSPTTALLAATSLTLGWTGTLSVSRGGTGTGTTFTAGSVIFAGASGVYSQNNANLFWDDANNRLGIGTATPGSTLDVTGTAAVSTSVTSPIIIGGIGTTSTLRLRSTSGVGTTGADIIFQVGNNGATEAMRVLNSGDVGIGTTAPLSAVGIKTLQVSSASSTARIILQSQTTSKQVGLFMDSSGNFGVYDYGSSAERMRIDSNGVVLINTTSATNNARLNQKLAVVSTGAGNYGGAAITTYGGTTADVSSVIDLVRSRGTTDGSFTAVASGDRLGYIVWRGADGSAFQNAASIRVEVDGTPGAGSMPGRLILMTTPSGSAASLERLRIDASGNVLVTGVGGLGYGTGSGGAVTQATSRTTGVTLNKTNGAITLVSAAGTTTWQTFTVTNSTVAATDTIIVNQKSGTDLYQIFVTNVAAGSFKITFATTGGTTTEQPVFNFAVIKAVTA